MGAADQGFEAGSLKAKKFNSSNVSYTKKKIHINYKKHK
jgi:hypothetical protein